jgi:hypothetical protein
METVPDRKNVAADPGATPRTNGIGPHATGADNKRLRRRKIVIAASILFVAAWVIALIYSVTAGGRSPERLNNADATVAETACKLAQSAMTALPPVGLHASIDVRSNRVSSEDAILTTMINQMRTLRPDSEAPKVALNAWLDDWEKLVVARQHYSHDLRTLGLNARFVEPAAVGIQPIADKMNDWILEQGTRTDACNTGQLQAEVVEGPRIYGKESNS